MKRVAPVFLLLVLLSGSALAQGRGADIGLTFPQFSLLFHPAPAASDAATLPLVEGNTSRGKERFGIVLRSLPSATPVVEILDGERNLLKGITVNDLLGRSTGSGVKLIGAKVTAANRRTENLYEIATTQGALQLTMKGIAAGDSSNPAQQHLIVTFSVKGSGAQSLALRLTLPVQGTSEAHDNGFVLSAAKGAAAISAAIYPKPVSVVAGKGTMTITGSPVAVTAEESALLWLVFDGSTASTPAAAKQQVAGSLDLASRRRDDPNILVISTTDRSSIRPSDTVALTLICVNIGTKGASGVTLKNPVPPGTVYMAGSAEGEGTEVLYDREGEAVRNVKWKMKDELKPGDDQVVTFRAVVE